MVAQLHEDFWSGSNRAVGFAQGAQRLLFVAVDEPMAGRPRAIDAQVVDQFGNDIRFNGVAAASVVSLASADGSMLVGVLNDHVLSGSVVFADGNAQKFAVELALI